MTGPQLRTPTDTNVRNLLHASLTRQVSIHRPSIPTGDGTLHYLSLSSLASLCVLKPYTPLVPHPFSRSDLALSLILSTRKEPITITLLSSSSHSLIIFCSRHRSLPPHLMQTHTSWLRSRWNTITIVLYPSYLALSVPVVRSSFPL